MVDDSGGPAAGLAVLAAEEADRRKAVLARLQEVLAVHGLASVLAARHILVLRGAGPAQPSGPGNPELHILGAGRRQVITTDGRLYHFGDVGTHPADDPGGAAGCVLFADIRHDWNGHQPPASADHGAARRDGIIIGAGEGALRRLREEGVI